MPPTTAPAGTVYEITCRPTGARYIGATRKTVAGRWARHQAEAAEGSDTHLHRAIRTHGAEAFSVRALETVANVADLVAAEARMIAQEGTTWPHGLNGRPGRKPAGARAMTAAERSAARHARTQARVAELETALRLIAAVSGFPEARTHHTAAVDALARCGELARQALGD